VHTATSQLVLLRAYLGALPIAPTLRAIRAALAAISHERLARRRPQDR
jgi:hypothetical protein